MLTKVREGPESQEGDTTDVPRAQDGALARWDMEESTAFQA